MDAHPNQLPLLRWTSRGRIRPQFAELTDHNGQTRKLQDFAGKVVVMFFGYTQCPDVCPTTLSEMAEVKKALGQDGDRLQVLFVSGRPRARHA